MRLTLEEMGAEVGETYDVCQVGDVVCLDNVKYDGYKADVAAQEAAHAEELAKNVKKAVSECQRAAQGLRWALGCYEGADGADQFAKPALEAIVGRIEDRAMNAGTRSSDLLATLKA